MPRKVRERSSASAGYPLPHDHDNVPPNLVIWAQGVTETLSGREGWFYAGRIGSCLKIGITKGCPFCRMDHQSLEPLGLAWSDDCKRHESDMKRALGTPAHGAEFFSDYADRFAWMVDRGYINELWTIASRLALKCG